MTEVSSKSTNNLNKYEMDQIISLIESNLLSHIDSKINTNLYTILNEIRDSHSSLSMKLTNETNTAVNNAFNNIKTHMSNEINNVYKSLPNTIDISLKSLLYNNARFDELFKSYSQHLDKQLSDLSNNIIKDICKDPHNNTVINSYLENVSNTCSTHIANNQTKFEKDLISYKNRIDEELTGLEMRYKKDFGSLANSLDNINTLHNKISKVETNNKILGASVGVLFATNIAFAAKVLRYI